MQLSVANQTNSSSITQLLPRGTNNSQLRLDILRAFGANLSSEIRDNLLFINNALCYPVGHHLILRDLNSLAKLGYEHQGNDINNGSSNNNDKKGSSSSSHKNDSLFIYLEDEIQKINCLSVSSDNFLLLVCGECHHKCYITTYCLTKLSFLTIRIYSPKRRVITNKYKRFIHSSFSTDGNCVAAIGQTKEGTLQGVIYDIQSYQKFKKNNYTPKNVFDLPNGVTKITYNNKILCTSGKKHLSFWFLFEESCKEYKSAANINKNYVDHVWIKDEKQPTVATVTEDNDIIIFCGIYESVGITKKNIDDLKIERFAIKQTIANAFQQAAENINNYLTKKLNKDNPNKNDGEEVEKNNDGDLELEDYTSNNGKNNNSNKYYDTDKSYLENIKSTCINSCTYGLVVGTNKGNLLFLERNTKTTTNEYSLIRYTRREKEANCTGITFNRDDEIMAISFETNEIAYINIKNVYANLKNKNYVIDFNLICDGFHSGPITTMDVAQQRPIIITTSKVDKTVRVWNYLTGYCEYCKIILEEKENSKETEMEILSVAIHPNGYYIAISDFEMIRFFHLCYKELRFYNNDQIGNEQSKRNCTILKFSNGGHLLAAVSEKKIYIIRSFSRETIKTFVTPHNNPIIALYFHINDNFLYSCSNDGIIVQYNLFDFTYVKIASKYNNYRDSCLCAGYFHQNLNNDKNKNNTNNNQNIHNPKLSSNNLFSNSNKEDNNKGQNKKKTVVIGIDENGNPYEDNIISCGLSGNDQSIVSGLYFTSNKTDEINQVQYIQSKMENTKANALCHINTKRFDINSVAIGTEIGQMCLFSHELKHYIDTTDEKGNGGDININANNSNNNNVFLPRWDCVYAHNKKVNFIYFSRDTNLLFSAGDDGVIFIYAIYEYPDGDTAVFEDNSKSLAINQLNSILDEGLGDNVLFSLFEMNDLYDQLDSEKDKNYSLKKLIDDNTVHFEKQLKDKEIYYTKMKENEISIFKKKISDDDLKIKNLIEHYEKEIKDSLETARNKYDENEKYLTDKIDELNNIINQKSEEIVDTKKEYEKKLTDNENEHIKKFRELEYTLQKKFKEYFNKNEKLSSDLNEQMVREQQKLNIIETEHELEIETRAEKYQKKIFQNEKELEEKDTEISKLRDAKDKLEKKVTQNENNLKKIKEENDRLLNLINNLKTQLDSKDAEKDSLSKKLTESEQILQEKSKLTSFSNQLKNELYKKNYELSAKYNNEINTKEELKESSKVLEKQLEESILLLVNREKEMNKQKILIDELKNKWEQQKKETNLIQKDYDNLLKKIYYTFQSNDKNVIIKGIREIYHRYLSQDADKNYDSNNLVPDVRKELENHIEFLQKQLHHVNNGKCRSENIRKFAYQKKMQENSMLIEEMTRIKKITTEYSNEINRLNLQVLNLNTENSKLKNTVNSLNNRIKLINLTDSTNLQKSNEIVPNNSIGSLNVITTSDSSHNKVNNNLLKNKICHTDNNNQINKGTQALTNRSYFKILPIIKSQTKEEVDKI